MKIYCNERYCEEYKEVPWSNNFIDKWLCDKHKKMEKEFNLEKAIRRFIRKNLYENDGDIYWNWSEDYPAKFNFNEELKKWISKDLIENGKRI